MSKRKPVQKITGCITRLIKEAKAGNIKGKTIQFNCGDSLIVAVNKGTGLAKWYARVGAKTVLLGEYGKMEYKTASAKLESFRPLTGIMSFTTPSLEQLDKKQELSIFSWINKQNNTKYCMSMYPVIV